MFSGQNLVFQVKIYINFEFQVNIDQILMFWCKNWSKFRCFRVKISHNSGILTTKFVKMLAFQVKYLKKNNEIDISVGISLETANS